MILAFKIEMLGELHHRFGDRVDAVFFTDDWGTQKGTFISRKMFDDFFRDRYRQLVQCVHDCGWHFILHSCGKVNAFVPCFIDLGIDVLNLQQPQVYGIEELGAQAAGRSVSSRRRTSSRPCLPATRTGSRGSAAARGELVDAAGRVHRL